MGGEPGTAAGCRVIRQIEHRRASFGIHDENEHTAWVCDELGKGWETDTFETIEQFVDGGVFVDVGAWIGMFTIYAAPKAAWVYAIEPDPVARDMLQRNIVLNGVTNVTVLPCAVWDTDGELTLHVNSGLGDSMTGVRRDGEPLTVPCVSPASLWQTVRKPVDLLKVDTEGAETHILPGILEWPCPIHLSVHIPLLDGAHLSYAPREAERIAGNHLYYSVLVQ